MNFNILFHSFIHQFRGINKPLRVHIQLRQFAFLYNISTLQFQRKRKIVWHHKYVKDQCAKSVPLCVHHTAAGEMKLIAVRLRQYCSISFNPPLVDDLIYSPAALQCQQLTSAATSMTSITKIKLIIMVLNMRNLDCSGEGKIVTTVALVWGRYLTFLAMQNDIFAEVIPSDSIFRYSSGPH